MFVGVILRKGQYVETVEINAASEVTAKTKLTSYVGELNKVTEGHIFTFVDTNSIKKISKMYYN